MAFVSHGPQSEPRSLFNLDLRAAPLLRFDGDVCLRDECVGRVPLRANAIGADPALNLSWEARPERGDII